MRRPEQRTSTMDIAFEHKIRQRAYEIWMAAGMVDGAADEHWLLAKGDVLNETQTPAKATPRAAKAKPAAKAAVADAKTAKAEGAKSKVTKSTGTKSKAVASKVAKPAVKAVRKAAASETHAAV